MRAFNGESESDWSDSSDAVSTNAELAPRITEVAVTSTPLLTSSGGATPDTYGAGDDIEFSVTFSAAVEVTGDPQFGFSLAGARVADYDSGSGSATLRFIYTVQPTDRDDNGIWVGNHATGNATLQLDADDAITSLGGTDDANLEHTALEALPGHKVDGSRTAGEPVEVTLHLSDADGEVGEGAGPVTVTATASPASAAAFTVTVSASAVGPATDDDFELSSNRVLSFDATATESAGTVTIAPVDDGDPEPNQVVTVSGSASIADVIGPGDVTLTIRDDDLIRISGICNRTRRVEDRILQRLKYVHSFKGGCGDVNETHLAKVKFLGLRRNPSTESAFTLSLRSDDFKGLVNLEELDLADTRLSSLPSGVFAGLASLETLNLNKNRLRSLPAGVFDGLTSLETLRLQQNSSLRSLPYDEFEALPNLRELRVDPEGRRGYQMAGSERDVELEVEPGGETTYQVRLTHRPTYSPTEQPTLTVSSDAAGVVATPRTLRFTRENWFRRQTVRVVALASAAGTTATLSHTSVAVTLDRPIPTVTVRVPEAGGGQGALKGRFVSPPQRHDGEKRVKVRVEFSEPIDESPENVGEHGVRVEGGEVTSVRPVDGPATGGAAARNATRSASRSVMRSSTRSSTPSASGGSAGEVVWELEIEPDSDGDLTISLEAGRSCDEPGAICTADGRSLSEGITTTVEGPDTGPTPLAASFEGMPEAHDGERAFTFRVAFSEPIGISYRSLREDAFTVTGGRVTSGLRVDDRRDLFEMTVEPDGGGEVTIMLPAGRECGVSGAICTKGENRRQLANTPTATVAGPRDDAPVPNTAATGAPIIAGTPRVDETLTASTSGISDADGLQNASFAFQWMRTDSDIAGATGSTYTAVAADEGKRLKVLVGFTDDAGNEESRTSAATEAVAAAPEPLTASFVDVPSDHDGSSAFTLKLAFSEPLSWMSGRRLREDVVAVSGGRATKAGRVNRRRDLWKLTVEPDSVADVTVTLAAGAACGTPAAVCTSDGRALSNTISTTVRGPVTVSVADARAREGTDETIDFQVTLSRAASATVSVTWATADGTATAGEDYTRAGGKLRFAPGETGKTVRVPVVDDAVDEGEETFTLRLLNASGARIADGTATGTIENSDPLQKMWLSRFGRTVAGQVVDAVAGGRLSGPTGGSQVTLGGQSIDLSSLSADTADARRSLAGALGAAEEDDPLAGPGPLEAARAGSWDDPETGATVRGLTGRELLLGSSFHLAASGGEAGGPGYAAWGRVAVGGFDAKAPAEKGDVRLDGEVTTGILGADAQWERWLAGVALSVSEGRWQLRPAGRGFRDRREQPHEREPLCALRGERPALGVGPCGLRHRRHDDDAGGERQPRRDRHPDRHLDALGRGRRAGRAAGGGRGRRD